MILYSVKKNNKPDNLLYVYLQICSSSHIFRLFCYLCYVDYLHHLVQNLSLNYFVPKISGLKMKFLILNIKTLNKVVNIDFYRFCSLHLNAFGIFLKFHA